MSLSVYPILVTLNECFGESFVFWNTVANFGSTTGAFVMPVVVERSLEAYGFQGAFLIMGGGGGTFSQRCSLRCCNRTGRIAHKEIEI